MGTKQLNSEAKDKPLVEMILEAAVDGIIFLNDSASITYSNRAGREILRCARVDDPSLTFTELADMLGFNPLEISLEAPRTHGVLEIRRTGDAPRGDVEHRSPPRLWWEQEATIHGVPYLVRGIRLASPRPNSSGTLLFLTDRREMQQKEQVISDKISFACHEMRTPLTAIKNALDLLSGQRLGELSDEQLRFVQLASRNAERLDMAVTSFLDLSRMESQTLELDLQKINVVEPVERVLTALQETAREKEITVQTQLRETYPTFLGDADRLGQAIYNLVHNAIKFTPERGSVQISLEMLPHAKLSEWIPGDTMVQLPEQLPEHWLLLTVADSGAGIPDRYMKSIFSKFVQAEEQTADSSKRGRGLGLSIVKAVVEAHGGVVWVESKAGMGSRFRVLLPELTREDHFVAIVAATLERTKTLESSLTLAILKVVPETSESASDAQPRERMLEFLHLVSMAVQSTVRLKSDRIEVLEPSMGMLALLVETKCEFVPALINRVTARLRQQAKAEGQILGFQIIWGMAGYPSDATTAKELVVAAKEAASSSEAEVIDFRLNPGIS